MDFATRIRERVGQASEPLEVLVLLGGESTERVVSLASGIAAGVALAGRGHRVALFDPSTLTRAQVIGTADPEELGGRFGLRASNGGLVPEIVHPAEAQRRRRRLVPSLTLLSNDPVDVAFNLLHGGCGEGGLVNGILAMMGVPYVGSDAISSAAAMDKGVALSVLKDHGVPIAPHLYWRTLSSPPTSAAIDSLGGYPVVVKPLAEGSTVGITIVRDPGDWPRALEAGAPFAHPVRGLLVEHFVPGKELTVGMLGDEALAVVEIVPEEGFYDFTRKYTPGTSRYLVPAPIDAGMSARLRDHAEAAFRELGCRDYGRVDFRVSEVVEVACLEVNTIPGMTATSLLPMAAKDAGIGFGELCELLCLMGRNRGREETPVRGAKDVR